MIARRSVRYSYDYGFSSGPNQRVRRLNRRYLVYRLVCNFCALDLDARSGLGVLSAVDSRYRPAAYMAPERPADQTERAKLRDNCIRRALLRPGLGVLQHLHSADE